MSTLVSHLLVNQNYQGFAFQMTPSCGLVGIRNGWSIHVGAPVRDARCQPLIFQGSTTPASVLMAAPGGALRVLRRSPPTARGACRGFGPRDFKRSALSGSSFTTQSSGRYRLRTADPATAQSDLRRRRLQPVHFRPGDCAERLVDLIRH